MNAHMRPNKHTRQEHLGVALALKIPVFFVITKARTMCVMCHVSCATCRTRGHTRAHGHACMNTHTHTHTYTHIYDDNSLTRVLYP